MLISWSLKPSISYFTFFEDALVMLGPLISYLTPEQRQNLSQNHIQQVDWMYE
jgi:hypothetical protein